MNPQTPTYAPQKSSKLPVVVLTLLLLLTLVFGLWAFSQMQTYKNKSDQKSAAAVDAAKKQLTLQLQTDFDKQAKAPYKTYQASATYGSITFDYPKTWSAYDAGGSDEALNLYFFPGVVPNTDGSTAYPLRVELLSTDYASVVDQFSSGTSDGSVKASAYVPPKMKGVTNVTVGTRFDGAINQNNSTTQTAASVPDLDNIVLASLTFVP